jgi:hypothetical protein
MVTNTSARQLVFILEGIDRSVIFDAIASFLKNPLGFSAAIAAESVTPVVHP